MRNTYEEDWILQQDNASIHTFKLTNNRISSENIGAMDWSAKSPDLNSIENLLGVLARNVYGGGRPYRIANELACFVLEEWEKICSKLVKNLGNSMQDRCINVLQNKGGKTKY